ncbi:ABC-three component system middle component 1 [Aeribacillus sp. FSL K6-2848]|uniref:ABC-three component system middle component 1 n=1 Tax=Aeribacillus sp. FSL K6-2848 TaxID=2954612 RepID=UPI0030FCF17C
MKQIIEKIFEEKDFLIDKELLKDRNNFFAERTNNNKFDFFVVMFESLDSFEKENVEKKIENFLTEIIITKTNYLGIDKNLSLLLLLNIPTNEYTKQLNNLIYDFEEDPYDFKKYVLVYTDKQVALLKERLTQSGENILNYLQYTLLNADKFTAFKQGISSEETLEYDLITKLYIKLPFLNINYETKQLSNVEEEIKQGINKEDYEIWEKLIQYQNEELIEDELDLDLLLQELGVEGIE